MKLAITLLTTLILPLLPANSVEWTDNYEKAVNQSKTTGKPLLMLFTGTEWCSWCKKLEKEVLATPTFTQEVGNKFVFLKLEFPSNSPQNKQLVEKYSIAGYPSIIILDAQQLQVIGKIGYQQGGPKNYAAQLMKLVSDYSSYKQKTSQLDQKKFSGAELKKLFEQAKELDIYTDLNRILKAGLASDEKLFFQLERYRFLVAEGSPRNPEAIRLRKEIVAADQKNARKLPFQLAVIDFEALSEEIDNAHYTPDAHVGPLISYIEQFGETDRENLWRLEMIISQVYLDHNKLTQATKYAQSAHDAAPDTVKPELAKAIRNIQFVAQIH